MISVSVPSADASVHYELALQKLTRTLLGLLSAFNIAGNYEACCLACVISGLLT